MFGILLGATFLAPVALTQTKNPSLVVTFDVYDAASVKLAPDEPLEPEVPAGPVAPLEPDDPDEPQEPLDPDDQDDHLLPDEPFDQDEPLVPDVPLVPDEPLVPASDIISTATSIMFPVENEPAVLI